MRRIIAIVLSVVLICTALVSCGNDSTKDFERVRASGKLVVGMECAYAPYNWTVSTPSATTHPIANNPGAYADGYDVEIARIIAAALNVELEIIAIEWDGLVPALEAGEIDMIIAGMSPTEERKLSISFSDTYYDSDLVMVVNKNSAYASATSISDFSGARITGQLNTFHYSVIDQISGVNKTTALQDFSALIQSLQSGVIDGYVCEKPGAISAVASNPDFTYVEFADGEGFTYDPTSSSIAVGVRLGSDLVHSINFAISGLSDEEREIMMEAAIARQPNAE